MTRQLALLVAALTAVPFAANAVEIRSATVDGVKIEAAVAPPTQSLNLDVSKAVPVESISAAAKPSGSGGRDASHTAVSNDRCPALLNCRSEV